MLPNWELARASLIRKAVRQAAPTFDVAAVTPQMVRDLQVRRKRIICANIAALGASGRCRRECGGRVGWRDSGDENERGGRMGPRWELVQLVDNNKTALNACSALLFDFVSHNAFFHL